MPYSFVQYVQTSLLSSETLCFVTAPTTTAGNLLVAVVTWDPSANPSAIASVTDGAGNVYTPCDSPFNDSVNSANVQAFYCSNSIALSSSNNVNFNLTLSNGALGLVLAEYSGINTTSPFDNMSSNVQQTPGTGASGVTTGSTANLKQPALVYALAVASGGGGTPTAEAASTSRGTGWDFGLGTQLMCFEDKRVTAISGVSSSFTAAANSAVMSIMLIFDEVGASGGGGGGGTAPPPVSNTVIFMGSYPY